MFLKILNLLSMYILYLIDMKLINFYCDIKLM